MCGFARLKLAMYAADADANCGSKPAHNDAMSGVIAPRASWRWVGEDLLFFGVKCVTGCVVRG